MIKWKATMSGRYTVGFGLEEGNLKHLRRGNPIHILAEQFDLPFDVVIYYGKDHAELVKFIEGGITEETILVDEQNRSKQ